MKDFFASIVIGHLLGDYIFQNTYLALGKARSSWICALHCLIYTIMVTLTTWPSIHAVTWSLFIFVSHFVMDRWSVGDKWLALIRSRTLKGFAKDESWKTNPNFTPYPAENLHILSGGFTAYVYAVTDNAFHLISMYYVAQLYL
jgi:hypothetical protein